MSKKRIDNTTHPDGSLLLRWENQASPHYTEGHRKYRLHVRAFVEKEVAPYAEEWNRRGEIPNFQDFVRKVANYGGIWMFPFGFVKEWNGYKWDPFYTIVFSEEWAKPVFNSGVHIHNVCLKPLQLFGKAPIHKKCLKELMSGDSNISLAVSELTGGSDVQNIKTSAKLDESGENYIINGNKYWITGGHRAHYFLTLVRTGMICFLFDIHIFFFVCFFFFKANIRILAQNKYNFCVCVAILFYCMFFVCIRF